VLPRGDLDDGRDPRGGRAAARAGAQPARDAAAGRADPGDPRGAPADLRRPARRRDPRRGRGDRGRGGRRGCRRRAAREPRPRQPVRHPAPVRDAAHDRAARNRAVRPRRARRTHPRPPPLKLENHHMPRRALALARAIPTLLLILIVAGCAAQPGGATASSGPAASSAPTALTVGLGYIPSVQFAPFYLADQAGYYRDAGLAVSFQNKIDPDLVTLVGQGAIDVGVADGTSVIPAVSQGIPIRYVATIYGTYPSIVFAKQSSGIKSAADLRGKKLGIPGKYGSSWIMLQALLESAGLKPSDLTITEYPDFGQGVAVQ